MWKLHRRLHSSWVVALSAAWFVVGVGLVVLVRLPWWWGLGGVVLCLLGFWFRQVWALPLMCLGALLVGLGYGSAHMGTRQAYAQFIGSSVTLSGRLKEDVSKSTSGSYSLQLESVYIGNQGYPGTVLVMTRAPTDAKRGELVTATGMLQVGFGSFPASLGSARITYVQRTPYDDIGRAVRDWFASKVRQLIPEPQASLGIGFLTGQKSALPDDLSTALKIAGLTHIVVASGYNLTILVRLGRRLFLNVSKYLSLVCAGLMIVLFVAMTGLSPSMTRAGLVSSLSLLAWYYGRSFHPFVLLPVVAAITVAMQPSYVWGDVGWQLSFAAFASVMLVAPLLQHYFFGDTNPGTLRQILGETVAAHCVTLPIIALSFGTVSNVAVVANLLVVPFVPLAMLMTFVCGLWSIAGLGFAWLVAAPTGWLLSYMTNVAMAVANIDWAQTNLTMSGWLWLGYALLLLGACYWMWRVTRYDFRGNEPLL